MTHAVTVRVAELSDLPAILGIYAQPAVDSGEVLPDDVARALYEKIRQYPSYHLYVACIGPDIVGTFALLIMDNLGTPGPTVGGRRGCAVEIHDCIDAESVEP